jgi:hypothetical protein
MYTFDGTRWSEPSLISRYDGSPDSVSCPTNRFCVAIDNGGSAYVFNGTKWSKPAVIDSIPPANQTAVSCASSAFCVAIDDGGGVETFNGTRWTMTSMIDPTGGGYSSESCSENQEGTCSAPAAIACPSSSFCAAVDGTGSVFTFDGRAWSAPIPIDAESPIVSLSCPSSGFCVALDSSGNAAMFDGTSWTAPASIDAMSGLTSVSCPSSGFCVAVDGSGNAVMFNGSSWSAPTKINRSGLASVSCPSSGFCVAVSQRSDVLTFGSAHAFPQSPVIFGASSARVSSTGAFVVPVSCPRGTRNCSGSVSLASAARHGTIAKAAFDLAPGERRRIKLKLSRTGLTDIEHAARHRLRVTATTHADQSVTKTTLTLIRS